MCACPSTFIIDAQARTAPCTPIELWAILGGQTATCRPLPPPPPSLRSCHSGGVPSGPPCLRGLWHRHPGHEPGQAPRQGSVQRALEPLPLPFLNAVGGGPVHDSTTSA